MTSLIWSRGELVITYLVLASLMLLIVGISLWLWRRTRSDLAGLSVAVALSLLIGAWWERVRGRHGTPQWPDHDTSVLLPQPLADADAEFDEWCAQIIALASDAYLCRECAHAVGLRPVADSLGPSRPWWCEGCERDTACYRRADFTMPCA